MRDSLNQTTLKNIQTLRWMAQLPRIMKLSEPGLLFLWVSKPCPSGNNAVYLNVIAVNNTALSCKPHTLTEYGNVTLECAINNGDDSCF